jgi:hypothetical protein
VLREALWQIEQELAVKWLANFAAKFLHMLPLGQRPLSIGRTRNQEQAGRDNRRAEVKRSCHGALLHHPCKKGQRLVPRILVGIGVVLVSRHIELFATALLRRGISGKCEPCPMSSGRSQLKCSRSHSMWA